MTDGILIGGSAAGSVTLDPRYANRHGLVAGATGTGKTVTLQCLAEGFSDLRHVDRKIRFFDDAILPDHSEEIVFRKQTAGVLDQDQQQIEGFGI